MKSKTLRKQHQTPISSEQIEQMAEHRFEKASGDCPTRWEHHRHLRTMYRSEVAAMLDAASVPHEKPFDR